MLQRYSSVSYTHLVEPRRRFIEENAQYAKLGMATNIPPHNLGEVIDGCVAYIEDPDIDLSLIHI